MRWAESWRADPSARVIADGHYTRQSIGADQFVPPGRCVVLVIPGDAYWVTSWPFPEYVKHAWPGAWICSAFRQIRKCTQCGAPGDVCAEHPTAATRAPHLSSELVVEALAGTSWYWTPPREGMITFVDEGKTKRKRDPGRCFRRAGFHVSGSELCCGDKPCRTEGGLLALHISGSGMPAAAQPLGAQSMLVFA